MPYFSERSLRELQGCDPRLQAICHAAIEIMDFTVVTGHRGEEEQNEAFRRGRSKLRFPLSKHNKSPSLAMDLAPYPIDWSDQPRFFLLAGIIIAIADHQGVKIRWGGDWDGDFNLKENRFDDIGHFEIS